MTVRVEAGRLTHVDLGKIVEVPSGISGTLTRIEHNHSTQTVAWISRRNEGISLGEVLDPHTLVTITGKDTHDG